jgi:hypothetical protein
MSSIDLHDLLKSSICARISNAHTTDDLVAIACSFFDFLVDCVVIA